MNAEQLAFIQELYESRRGKADLVLALVIGLKSEIEAKDRLLAEQAAVIERAREALGELCMGDCEEQCKCFACVTLAALPAPPEKPHDPAQPKGEKA